MAAGKFKNQCLKVLDRVAATRTPITITKRGKPVAMLVPHAPQPAQGGLAGSILRERGTPYGTGEEWDADAS
jgi:prevent-host-death family protein